MNDDYLYSILESIKDMLFQINNTLEYISDRMCDKNEQKRT